MAQTKKRLTAKQEALARELARSKGSAASAARALGMHRNSASRMLAKVDVQDRVERLRDRYEKNGADKAARILDRAQDVVLSALEDPNADATFAAAVMRPALDVRERMPIEEGAITEESPRQRAARLRSHIHAAIVGARNPALLPKLLARLRELD